MACALVCVFVCGCICYLYIYMYVHNAYRHAKNIIYSCVGVLVFAFYPLPLSCSTCFLSLFFFLGVCNQPFYMPRLRFIRPHRHSINNNARRRSRRCCCCYSIFCCFNGMPLNNFIKCFVWTLKRHKKGLFSLFVALSSSLACFSHRFYFVFANSNRIFNQFASYRKKTHTVKSWIKHKFTHCV